MRLPRWLVLSLLGTSALTLVLTTLWWWSTWPERTAREFIAAIEQQRFGELKPFIKSSWYQHPKWSVDVEVPGQSPRLLYRPSTYSVTTQVPSWADRCRGHGTFDVQGDGFERYRFEVTRGKIV